MINNIRLDNKKMYEIPLKSNSRFSALGKIVGYPKDPEPSFYRLNHLGIKMSESIKEIYNISEEDYKLLYNKGIPYEEIDLKNISELPLLPENYTELSVAMAMAIK